MYGPWWIPHVDWNECQSMTYEQINSAAMRVFEANRTRANYDFKDAWYVCNAGKCKGEVLWRVSSKDGPRSNCFACGKFGKRKNKSSYTPGGAGRYYG